MPHAASNSKQIDPALLLDVLSAVDVDKSATQRVLSAELGISLGLVNAVLRRCVRKGVIKISVAPLNRYVYYLTPSGMREKARLTAEYVRSSFDMFREARSQYTELLRLLTARGVTRVALLGASELAEVAILSSHEAAIKVAFVVDPAHRAPAFLHVPVVHSLHDLPADIEALVLCDVRDPKGVYTAALGAWRASGFDDRRVLAPALLRIRERELDAQ
jgi:DNA-binding MarR family transcriptional regulator